jgi:KDO2-lipid IV(A) lauroyltransferase
MLTLLDKIILFPLYVIGNMPMWVLHGMASFFYFIMYPIIGYRKKVVLENLRKSFPEKDEKEIHDIAKKFYKQLTDVFFESLYLLRMKPEESVKRYTFKNTKAYEDLYAHGKSIICVTGHYANWEWSCCGWFQMPHRTAGVYKPLMNKRMDRFFIHLRTRMGSQVVPMNDTFKWAVAAKRANDKFGILLVGDQRPGSFEIKYWLNFMNQETPVIYGPEKMAKKLDAAVVFFDVQRVKRGYYEVYPVVISAEPKKTGDFEITHRFFEVLEEQIRKRPESYLWSHKRWKYNKKQIDQLLKDHNFRTGDNPLRK